MSGNNVFLSVLSTGWRWDDGDASHPRKGKLAQNWALGVARRTRPHALACSPGGGMLTSCILR